MAVVGLTDAQASERRRQGQGNDVRLSTSRSYGEIIRANIFNFVNIILFTIGAAMILIGRLGDAVTSVGLILVNVLIGVAQEIRAKRQLDRIALLTRPRVTIVRNGEERSVDPSELVLGDVIAVRPGDQIVVDGELLEGELEADEALLTGEADLIRKKPGDTLLSGSFCVSGAGYMEATRVGEDSFANKLTTSARRFEIALTPLQREINFVLRLLMLLAGFLGLLFLISFAIASIPLVRQVQAAAIIAGLIPNGLFFMVILAYAIGALRIVRRGALVQQTNAVEALSNVTVLCTDKTGTLTANRINYDDAWPVGLDKAELEQIAADMASSAAANNKTGEAIVKALGGTKRTAVDEVPFSSALKWSAIAFDDRDRRGVYVMGAPEMLLKHVSLPPEALARQQEWADQGFRVLVVAHNPDVLSLHDADGEPALPPLQPLGLLRFSDELRPHLKETLNAFISNGIELKIISGDNPHTVASLARQAGFTGELAFVSGVDLAEMDESEFDRAVRENVVFGRITPEQKERIVDALRAQGHYVAMIGDGVNDVLSLKKADMGIAMESGSSATRAVADMILIGDSFEALPPAFTEGQRIINGMSDILRLFLTRVLYSALLIVSTAIIGLGFPFLPKHNALIVLLSVGIPTIGLALWARPGPLRRRSLLAEIAHFVVPAGLSVLVFGLVVYIGTFYGTVIQWLDVEVTPEAMRQFTEFAGIDNSVLQASDFVLEVAQLTAQTALAVFTTLAGLTLVVFVEPPTDVWVGGDVYSGDKRPTLMAALLLLVFIAVLAIEPARTFFELAPLPLEGYVLIALMTAIWAMVLRLAWRHRWLERFLQIDLSPLPAVEGKAA
ncbi:MAG: HAD-IC family P-type ATPase [Chloroflexota bacterium]|nr:MAG: haloacid dehalogenase [Chloroflexota bacterium]